ncbi:MAG: HAMP domain-containing protein [Holophaga sp.]|nr:HAMP domain-containing protein [Holophaga sp.]
METEPKPKRPPELHRLYTAVFLLVLIGVLFRGYRIVSNQVEGGLDATSRWALLALGLANTLAIGTLLFIIARTLAKLYFERRRGILGARIRTRLVVAFFVVCFAPSLLLYLTGKDFISKNVKRWFLPETQQLITDGDRLTEAFHKQMEARLHIALERLPQNPTGDVEDLRQEAGLDLLVRQNPGTLSQALAPELPAPDLTGVVTELTRQDTGQGLWVLSATAVARPGPRFVAGLFIPRELHEGIMRLDRRSRDSSQIHAFRNSLETLPQNTFLLLTLTTLFFAVWVGLAIARTISEPVRALAKAAQRVGTGDLDVVLPVHGEDELAFLSQSFNAMTRDLRQNREAIEAQAERIERQRAYLGQLLEALPVGVLGWNKDGELRTFNPTARRWLGLEDWDPITSGWSELAGQPRLGGLPALVREVRDTRHAQEEELRIGGEGDGRPVRAIIVPISDGGELAVLEDLSLLAQAEKRAAWQEVARRMAHEVKNPLTPIQLTAQRLLRRAREGRLDPQIVTEGAETILVEVSSLSRLVDSFSRFAKLPAPQPQPLDACELLRQVQALYAPIHPAIRFDLALPDGPVAVRWDGDMIKRALINFVDNAVSALDGKGAITLRLEPARDQVDRVQLEVEDDGPGVPEEARERLFEPYFSTKRKGTGLGLAIVRRIAQDHGGEAQYRPLTPGSRFSLILPVAPLG